MSNDVPQQSVLDTISSLILLPSKSDLGKPIASEYTETIISILDRSFPRLKHLLFKDIDFGSNIVDLFYFLQLKLDLVYLWNLRFSSSDYIWSALYRSTYLVNSMSGKKIDSFQFTIRANGHTTQVVINKESSVSLPNSPDLGHGLVLSLEQNLPNIPSLNDISLLIIIPSEEDRSSKQLSAQSKLNLKSVMSLQYTNLKYLVLIGMNLDGNIEDFIAISQLKLDLIYLEKCGFRTAHPLWSILCDSMKLVSLEHSEKVLNFQFAIPLNGHTTQVVINRGSSVPLPNSSNLGRGLILSLEQDPPKDLSLDNISLLAFFSSETDPTKPLPPNFKENLKLVMGRPYPSLKYLLLTGINFDGKIEDFIPVSQLKLDIAHLRNCRFKTADSIWPSLCESMKLVKLMYPGKVPNFQFAIPFNGHVTQIVFDEAASFFMPDSPELVHGLFISLEQDLPKSLSLDNISLLTLSLSEADRSSRQFSSQSKQNLKSMMGRSYPNLKYLQLFSIDFDNKIENFISVLQPNLKSIYLWNTRFETDDPIWSALCASMSRVDSMPPKKVHNFQLAARINGHSIQIIINNSMSHFISSSPDLVHGLILPLGQELPNDLLVDNTLFLTLLPSTANASNEQLCPQLTQTLKSIMSRSWSNLKYLFLKDVLFLNIVEMSAFIAKHDLDMRTL